MASCNGPTPMGMRHVTTHPIRVPIRNGFVPTRTLSPQQSIAVSFYGSPPVSPHSIVVGRKSQHRKFQHRYACLWTGHT